MTGVDAVRAAWGLFVRSVETGQLDKWYQAQGQSDLGAGRWRAIGHFVPLIVLVFFR